MKYEIDMKLPSLNEEWKPIKNYEGFYEISNFGRVRSLDREVILKHYSGCSTKHTYKGKILKPRKAKNGYLNVGLTKNKKQKHYLIHRLVAQAFLKQESGKYIINHLDTKPQNNNIYNLQWCTQSENIKYAYDIKTKIPPHMKKIIQMDLDGNIIKQYNSIQEAFRETKIQATNISKCCRGERNKAGGYKWQYVK